MMDPTNLSNMSPGQQLPYRQPQYPQQPTTAASPSQPAYGPAGGYPAPLGYPPQSAPLSRLLYLPQPGYPQGYSGVAQTAQPGIPGQATPRLGRYEGIYPASVGKLLVIGVLFILAGCVSIVAGGRCPGCPGNNWHSGALTFWFAVFRCGSHRDHSRKT